MAKLNDGDIYHVNFIQSSARFFPQKMKIELNTLNMSCVTDMVSTFRVSTWNTGISRDINFQQIRDWSLQVNSAWCVNFAYFLVICRPPPPPPPPQIFTEGHILHHPCPYILSCHVCTSHPVWYMVSMPYLFSLYNGPRSGYLCHIDTFLV